jgi:hypothetical protein
MKKIILATVLLTMSASMMTAQAAVSLSFADQLMMQKIQLRPQVFNFFSDRYKQVAAQENVLAAVSVESPSFKVQLDSQKQQLRMHKFNPVSDAFFQMISH